MSKRQRPSKGNVIYANFGNAAPASAPPATTFGSPGMSHAAAILQDVFVDNTDVRRIRRGREYASSGNVVTLEFRNGRIDAVVAGSQNDPFDVSIVLPPRPAEQLTSMVAVLLETGGLASARRGILDKGVVETLVSAPDEMVRCLCTCPDHAVVCKHVVAVLVQAIDRIDADPALVFALRGMDFAMIEKTMQQQATAKTRTSVENTDRFWQGDKLPPLPNPAAAPVIADSDLAALHKAMRAISYTAVDELRAVSDIEEMYDHLTRNMYPEG